MLDSADLRGVSRLYKLSQVGTGGDLPLSHLRFGPRSCAFNRHAVAALPQASTKAADLPSYGITTWPFNACENTLTDTRGGDSATRRPTRAKRARKAVKTEAGFCGGLSQHHRSRSRVRIEQKV